MPTERLFVGREEELNALKQAIAGPEGQLILLIGGEGRGKTALLEELNRQLADDPSTFSLLYQLNSNDTSDAFLDRLMGDFLRIGGLTKGRLVLGAPGQEKKWRDFLGATGKLGDIPFLGAAAKKITCLSDFLKILVPDDKRPPREKFLDFLRLAARRLGEKRRLVLLLDPEKYLDGSVAADSQSLVRDLPDGVALIFAQRPDDCLAQSDLIVADKVSRIPETPLGHLPRENSDELVAEAWRDKEGWTKLAAAPPAELCDLLWEKYQGWPLPLTMVLSDLPDEPEGVSQLLAVAQEMPKGLRDLLNLRYAKAAAEGDDAVRLLHALAILERPATGERVAALYGGECDAAGLTAAAHRPPVAKCLSQGEKGRLNLFHATMGECVVDQMSPEAKQDLHRRAAKLHRADLDANGSDKEALDRLPYHAYHAGEVKQFLEAVDRVGEEKYRLRLLRSYERDLRWALPLCRKLSEGEPVIFRPALAATLNNLGNVLSDLGERAQARQAFEEALAMYRKLAEAEPAAFEPDVASTLNNLGNVLGDLGERAQARGAYEEALSIRRDLAKAEPAAFEPAVATTLNNLGNALRDLGERAPARQAYEEAIAIYRKLAEAEPAAFEPYVAGTLSNLGNMLREIGERAQARPAVEEALAIYRKLAKAEPAAFEPAVAATLNNLGAVLNDLGERAQARPAFEEALAICRKLAEAEPAAFLPDVAMTLSNLGAVLSEIGEQGRARQAFVEALAIYRKLAKAEPAAFEPDLAMTLSNLGTVLRDLKKWAEARTAYEEALTTLTPWVQREPKAFRTRLVVVLRNAVTLAQQTGEKPEEWPALVEAAKLLDQLKAAQQDDSQDES